MPLLARRIAPTSRMTHRHPQRTRPRENDPSTSLTTPQTGNTGRLTGRGNGTLLLADMTTRRSAATPPDCLPTRRRNAERHGEYCYPPHDTTTRDERRDERDRKRSGTKGGTKKNGPPFGKKGGPENGTRYEIKRHAADYSPLLSESESSGKRGKSRRRER